MSTSRPGNALRHIGAAALAVLVGTTTFVLAQAPRPSAMCLVSGRVSNGTTPLPGVSLMASRDGMVVSATASDVAGNYRLRLPAGDYRITADLPAFAPFEQNVSLAESSSGSAPAGECARTLDVQLLLRSRVQSTTPSATTATAQAAPRPEGRGRGAAQGAGAQARFSQLQVVQAETAGAAETSSTTIDDADPATRLLPPGFSTNADTNVVAVTGDAASLDRGQLRDRLEALGRGEFDGAGFQRPDGFDTQGRAGGFGQFGGGFAQGGPGGGPGGPGPGGGGGGGRGFGGGGGGRGGGAPGGGRGAFLGRGRGQNPVQGSATYTFGGSALNAAPYPLRANTQNNPEYTQQQFGATVGGPLRLPGYDGSRTTFFFNYNGGRANNLFDQYATVPTAAVRAGDFGAGATVIDPSTGLAFANGRIPANRIDPGALALLQYIPLPNLPGTAQNFRRTTTALNASDGFSARVTHNFSSAAAQRGGGRGGRGGGGGFGGRGGGGRGRGVTGTAVVLNAQVQYRRNDSDAVNVFPTLGGTNRNSSVSAPIQVNVLHGRAIHNIQATVTRTSSESQNGFAGVTNVAALAGITGVSTDPFDWGAPSLSFSTFTGLRDLAPSQRSDRRVQLGYTMTRPFNRHSFRIGGDVRLDASSGRTDANANGSFVFTGLYSADGAQVARGTGLDFADFLLGRPQQATVQFGPGNVNLRGQAYSLFAQDDWRARGNLTFNLGVRYEIVRPFTEANGHMVNLDVANGFTAAAPVIAGGTGLFTGGFPAALINDDLNNVAPRVGVAWRASPRLIVRAGYGLSFNNGSYATIARQLVAQPPFAVTDTSIGTVVAPIILADPFASIGGPTTTNNYGVDKNYQLGVIHTWNVDITRSVGRLWQVGAGYTGTRGHDLDVIRAPNRGPDGLRIADVEPFLWQTAEGDSILHAGTFRLRRQPTRGIGGTITYTIARSIDDASNIGGGARVVAQNDLDLEAERGLSSFDRRHLLTGDLTFELPFGPNRRWLNKDGAVAGVLRDWSLSANVTAESGTPFTARLVGATTDVARGTNGTLRANYTGADIALANPTLFRFFNTDAFTAPPSGTFGDAGRNTIIGPGQHFLNAAIGRDVRLSGNRVVSVRIEANNVLNTVRYGAIDTVVNSPTFGQVISVQPMRTVQLNLRFRY